MACKRSTVRSRLAPPPFKSAVAAGSPSSRGPGHRPFTAVTGVRIPLGTPSTARMRVRGDDDLCRTTRDLVISLRFARGAVWFTIRGIKIDCLSQQTSMDICDESHGSHSGARAEFALILTNAHKFAERGLSAARIAHRAVCDTADYDRPDRIQHRIVLI